MAKKKKYTAQQVIDALQKADGYVSKTASLLKCNPQTVYNYRDSYKSVAEAWEAIREKRHDFVENALHNQISEGNTTATIFYLKTQAKHRGYVEKSEVEHSGKQVLQMDWGDRDDSD